MKNAVFEYSALIYHGYVVSILHENIVSKKYPQDGAG